MGIKNFLELFQFREDEFDDDQFDEDDRTLSLNLDSAKREYEDEDEFSSYLDKKYREAKLFTEGEVQYRLEQDAIDLRCAWVDSATKYISIPTTFIYLLYNSLCISWLYTVIVFIISIIPNTLCSCFLIIFKGS